MTGKANWAALGAIAAAASAFVALLAYAAPRGPSTANPFPASDSSQKSPPYTAPPQKQTGTQARTSPAFASPSLTLAQPAGPPEGCQQGEAAITRYTDSVGSTQYSKQQAARRAAQDVEMALGASGGVGGTIQEDLQTLSQDFMYLAAYASGGGPDASSRYNTTFAQTQKDIQAFNTDCNASG
jgi:hypothetical protein